MSMDSNHAWNTSRLSSPRTFIQRHVRGSCATAQSVLLVARLERLEAHAPAFERYVKRQPSSGGERS